MGRSVAHEHQCLILRQRRQPVQKGLCHGGIVFFPVQQRHSNGNLHPQPVRLQLGQHFLIFLAVHHMGGLDSYMGIALLFQPLHGLSHILNFHSIPLFQLPNNHSAGKGPANLPFRESLRKSLLRSGNGFSQGIGVRGSKGHC